MAILIEPTKEFNRIPIKLQEIVEKFFFGREFTSLEDVFNQCDWRGEPIIQIQLFYPAKIEIIPKDLPIVIDEVDIYARWCDAHNPFPYEVKALKAKFMKGEEVKR